MLVVYSDVWTCSASCGYQSRLTVNYPNMFQLMKDLRGMGEQNITRVTTSPSEAVFSCGGNYQTGWAGKQIGVPATFEIITLTGWAPHESQQKPLRPGSQRTRFSKRG